MSDSERAVPLSPPFLPSGTVVSFRAWADEALTSPRAPFLAGAGAVAIVIAVVVGTEVLGGRGTAIFSDLGQTGAAFSAAVLTALAARRSSGAGRRGWGLMAGATGLWAASLAVRTASEVGPGHHPTGDFLDAGLMAALPLALAGAIYLSSGARYEPRKLRTVLDGMIIATSLLLASFFLVLQGVHVAHQTSRLTMAVTLCCPIGYALVATVAFLGSSRASARSRRATLSLMGAAFVVLSVSGSYYAVASLSGTHHRVTGPGAGWFAGFVLIGAAALETAHARQPQTDPLAGRVQVAVPYIVMLFAVTAAVYYFAHDGPPSPFIRWGGTAVCALAASALIVHREELLGMVRQSRTVEATLLDQQSRLQQAQQHWELAFDHSPIGAAIITPDGTLARCNQSLADMLERAPQELQGTPFAAVAQPGDAAILSMLFSELSAGQRDSVVVDHDFRRRKGGVLSAHLEVAVIRDDLGQLQSMVAQIQDISERKRAEQVRAYEALHDGLTGLPNSAFLEEHIAELLRIGRPFGVAYCDLNRFKTVNDSLGRAAGDELLRAVAQRLSASLPGRCTVGRLVGDEFVLICMGSSTPEHLHELAAGAVSILSAPFDVRGHQHALGVSIGVTAGKPWHRHPDEVLREAHEALLRAKGRGRGRVEVYDPAQDNPATVADLELENALRVGLTTGRGLVPYFQPIVRLPDLSVVGHEALARWQHPDKGLLEPGAFLPLAEHTGLVVPLGWSMLEACCATLERGAPGPAPGSGWIAVNVSGNQLGRGQLTQKVHQALTSHGTSASHLHLEITEAALVETTSTIRRELSEVAEMGVSIALDDFGTGYSSLSMLRDLPVSAVKIDRSFVEPIVSEAGTAAIVHRLVELCRDMGIDSVAEGIETMEQAEVLADLGCRFGQGYLFGRPQPEAHLSSGDNGDN